VAQSNWNRISLKVPLIGITMIALSSGIIAWELYSHQKVKLEERIGKELIGIAAIAALGIDPDAHEDIYIEEDGTLGGLDSFEQIRDKLQKTVEVNQLEKPMYTHRKTFGFKETHMMEFVVMTDEKEGRHYAGNTINATKHVLMAYESGKPHATPLYSDEEGTWLSGLAPLKDEDGTVIAILSCDREVKFFLEDLAKVRATIFGTAGVSLLIGAFCFMLLSRPIVNGIQRLTRGVQMVGKNELSYRIDLVRPEGEGDEIDELATAFNRMVGGLEERIASATCSAKWSTPSSPKSSCNRKRSSWAGKSERSRFFSLTFGASPP
jgi:methyl-accepting chemotaxis protein